MNAHGHFVGSALYLRGAALLGLGALGEAVHHAQVVQRHMTLLARSQFGNHLENDAEIAGNAPQAIYLPRPLALIVAQDLGRNPTALGSVERFHHDPGESVTHVALVHVHLQKALLHGGTEFRRGEI